MKKVILFACLSGLLFAQTKSDVAFTAGYNKFNDSVFLKDGHMAYGIRGGSYKDNGLGYQLGFEHIPDANCKGLKLNRIYTNLVLMSPAKIKLKPYGLVTAGYEISSIHEHKPSQLFMGAGAGLRYELTPKVNAFIETRVLQKLKTDDTDIVTTLGVAYALDTPSSSRYAEGIPSFQKVNIQPRRVVSYSRPVLDSRYKKVSRPMHVRRYVESLPKRPKHVKRYVESLPIHMRQSVRNYYVQLAALSRSSASPILNKLYAKGITNANVQQVYRGSRKLSLVVVGPYRSKREATMNLKRFRKFNHGAFITKL